MPKRAVRILGAAVLTGLLGAAGSAQQSHGAGKAPAVPPPAATPVRASATTAAATVVKFGPMTRDVCDKHRNLKQCS
jgi:hypothetical protein